VILKLVIWYHFGDTRDKYRSNCSWGGPISAHATPRSRFVLTADLQERWTIT